MTNEEVLRIGNTDAQSQNGTVVSSGRKDEERKFGEFKHSQDA